ncbi:MAG: EAL domain-containing protein, partial [Acidimicrobiia bacterium]|nr:EAL domain-containing protein [Acidimicrobiia bacterium]
REYQIAESLPRAVAANEIDLEFQPRAAAKGNLIVGIEAFARWRHPKLGPVSPPEFLRVADRLELMPQLGTRLRDRAVGSAVGWFREAWLQDASLWLNVSYSELCRPGFAVSLSELREQYPDVSFGIEIQDGPLLDEPVIANQLEPVRRLGIDIALDNVGASAISLGRLHRLPISGVNLDGLIVHSLVSDPSYQHLAATICEIAHGRGMVVTACQAETREQLITVRSLGIDHVQGQVLAAPSPAAKIHDLLTSGLSANVDRRGR